MEGAVSCSAGVGVRAEEVAQALDEGGRQASGPQRVVIGQGGGEAGDGDAEPGGGGDHGAPGVLSGGEVLAELLVGQQRRQVGGGCVGGPDAVEESGPSDVAAG